MKHARLTFFAHALALAGCAATSPTSLPIGSGGSSACSTATQACVASTGSAGKGLDSSGATGANFGTFPMQAGAAGSASTSGAGAVPAVGSSGAAPATGVPCEVAKVVSARCTGCHQAPAKFGAPMSLMTLADFQAPARSNAARKVYQVIPERIDPADVANRMPPTSMPALTADEKQTLGAWLGAAALASANSCAISATDLVQGQAGASGGMPNLGHSGGSSTEPIEYDDPDMKCYKFLAHAQGNLAAPYSQGLGENYVNFTFNAPWQGTVYSRAIKLAIDPNSKVIHHWLLFKQSGPVTDGAIAPGTGTHPDGILLHGWAPGASPLYLDPDVGMKLEGDVGYELEVHFNNSTGAPGDDHSGAEVCVTTRVPPHVAELSWLGTDSISGTSAVGNCSPASSEPIHLIAAQPHMHLKGRHMQVVINRAGGGQDVIHDEDFSFDNQRYYVLASTLMPGDTMTTSCSYSAPATFGSSTNDEMCYFFTMHWPGGALRSSGIGTVLHGADSCM